MIRLNLTSLFYSNKNIELAYKAKKICRNIKINLINATDFVDLTLKIVETKPQVVLFDMTTVNMEEDIIKLFTAPGQYYVPNIILIYEDEEKIKRFEDYDFLKVKPEDLESFLVQKEKTFKFNALINKKNEECLLETIKKINSCLMDMGFSPKHTGYSYLLETIKILIKKDGSIGSLNNNIYPLVAAKFGTRVTNVERNIRNAIVCAWNNEDKLGEHEMLNMFKNRPTNREFICMCVEELKQFQDSKKYIIN